MSSSTQHAMRIAKVLAVPAAGAGYYEDLAALQAEHVPLPQRFTAPPLTPGFRAVREVAEAVSVGLVLDAGSSSSGGSTFVAWGDCVAVSYSGRAGRQPVLRASEGLATIHNVVAPVLEGRTLTSFRELVAEVDALTEAVEETRLLPQPPPVEEMSRRALLTAPLNTMQALRAGERPTEQVVVQKPIHTAIRYGVSQALLAASAFAQGVPMATVLAREWNLPLPDLPIPVHAQSGVERYYNAEKMIVRRIASLPHALVDNLPEQVGQDGSALTRYIRWLARRIGDLGSTDYRPTIHLDIYGALGQIFDHQPGQMLGQLYAWEMAARPYPLRIETPLLLDSRTAQIESMKALHEYVHFRKMTVQLVVDEWANTLEDIHAFLDGGTADMIQIKLPDLGSIHNAVEAVLACKAAGVGAFVGGSYAETDLSARVSVHVALAAGADLLMAKPGMGVDEAVSLVQNEMARTLAAIQIQRERGEHGG